MDGLDCSFRFREMGRGGGLPTVVTTSRIPVVTHVYGTHPWIVNKSHTRCVVSFAEKQGETIFTYTCRIKMVIIVIKRAFCTCAYSSRAALRLGARGCQRAGRESRREVLRRRLRHVRPTASGTVTSAHIHSHPHV